MQSSGYAAHAAGTALVPFNFERREMKPHDVILDIEFCGICHSDVHIVDNDIGYTVFPVVPGHEIVGRVSAIGSAVTKFAVGDAAAIGCYTDSCRVCRPCREGREQMCKEGSTGTFGSAEREGGLWTYGGFSNFYVADENYVLKMPAGLDPAAAAPLLCAGITTYSPLRKWKVGPGKKIGIVGIGGLGHLAIKLAAAMGAEVVVFTTSPAKQADALALGATHAVLSSDAGQMKKHAGSLEFILDTVSAPHDLNALFTQLEADGTLCLLGIAPDALSVLPLPLVIGQKSLTGSLIGGVAETQEMLDFCAEHGITADIEMITMQEVNVAYERLRRNDVKYRFVIDMSSLGA